MKNCGNYVQVKVKISEFSSLLLLSLYKTWDSVPNEVFVGQKDINELQRRVKYETNVKDTIHLGQVLKAEKLYVDKKKRLAFLSMLSSVSPGCMQTCQWCL